MASAEPLAPAGAARAAASLAPLLELSGIYYDPRGSQPRVALLRVDAERRVLVTGNGVDVACAAAELRIAPPLLGATLTSLRLPSGGALETADAAAVARLRELSGRPTPFARVHRWERSDAAVAAALVLALCILLGSYLWLIPLGAHSVAQTFPGVARQLGKGALGLLDRVMLQPSRLEPSVRERLQAHFRQLAADYPGVPLRLELRSAGVANAFALPDGTIVLTDQLVAMSRHDAELVAVLLHEVGHVVYGHGLRRTLESSAFLLLAMSYYGEVDQLTAIAGSLPISYAQSRYSRQEEQEADGMALAGLRRHGKDPAHFARILRALGTEVGPEKSERSYFSSHPALAERAERFERAPRARGP